MMNQFQIEKYVGIDLEVAQYMMTSGTLKAKHALDMLRICVSLPDNGSLALLQEAVKEVKHEILKSNEILNKNNKSKVCEVK